MLALNRLMMTLQNKRMPVAGFTVGRDGDGMRATLLLDCPPETARRYTALLSALEDVREAGPAQTDRGGPARDRGDDWRDGRRDGRGSKRTKTTERSWRRGSPRRSTAFSPLLAMT